MDRMAALTALLFLLLPVAIQASGADTTITYITPNIGGTNGAVRVHVFGTNFNVDLTIGETEPRTKVVFVSSLYEYDCDIHQAESDEQQTVCYTRQMQAGNYYLRMSIDGIWLDSSQYCGGSWTANTCKFEVVTSNTPNIDSIDVAATQPHSLVTINGDLFTDIVSSNVAAATNGATDTITRVWMTSGSCELFQDVDVPHGIQLDSETSNHGSLSCNISSSYVGNQNISFLVEGEHGRSLADTGTRHVSADNRIYMVQTYAVVSDVSPKTGSELGGTRLTITGNYFDDLSGIRARVLVGGDACEVESVSDTQIVCIVPSQPAAKNAYSGGRGLRVETLANSADTFDSYTAGDYSVHFWDSTLPNTTAMNGTYQAQTKGFFYAMETANYQFTIASSGDATLSVDVDGVAPNDAVTLVASTAGQTTSNDIALTAGEEYYFEVTLTSTTVNPTLETSVYIDTTIYTPEETSSAVSDNQIVVTSTTVDRETQTIELIDWSPTTAVATNFTLTFDCPSLACSAMYFRFGFAQTFTELITYGSNAYFVQLALTSLTALAGDNPVVTLITSGANQTSYQIVFNSDRGDLTDLVTIEADSGLTVTKTPVTAGSPGFATFTLEVNGYYSSAISTAATEAEVGVAARQLFESYCPPQLGATLGSQLFAFYDVESGGSSRPSGTITSEESFCGTYSTQNPWCLFYTNNDDDRIFLDIYKEMCFAHKGSSSGSLSFQYNYDDENGDDVYVNFESHVISGLADAANWTHHCVDIHSLLSAEHSGGSRFWLKIVFFHRSSSDADVYVDNVWFGVGVPADATIAGYVERIQPSAVPSIKVSNVQVTKPTATSFQLRFIPIDCGNTFPLLGVAFTGSSQVNSVDDVTYGLDWNNSRINIQRSVYASHPIDGTFDISWSGGAYESILNIPTNTTQEEMETLFEDLNGIDGVSISRSGDCYGYSWDVTIAYPGGRFPDLVADGAGLTGNSPVASVTRVASGGLFMAPVHGDFLSTAHATPQVQVFINNVPSVCTGNFDDDSSTSCDFQWMASATPQVSSVAPTTGSQGDTVTVTGSGFDAATPTNNRVLIGGAECVASAATDTSITCTVGDSPGGTQALQVVVTDKGLANVAVGYETFDMTSSLTSISPTSGSVGGCTTVTISGSGFEMNATTVTIGGSPCLVESASYSEVTCVTEAGTAGASDVVVTISGTSQTLAAAFEYVSVGVGSVASLSPSLLTVAGGEAVTITGSGFGTSEGLVWFDDVSVWIVSWTDTEIVLNSSALAPGTYVVSVHVSDVGCADGSAIVMAVTYSFSVTGISPTSGSLMGGTTVTVTGSGLSDDTLVFFDDCTCDDVTAAPDGSSLTCVTSPIASTVVVTNFGRHESYGYGYAWDPSVAYINAGDALYFTWSTPIEVDGIPIGPFTTADALSTEYDGDGFQVTPTTSGAYEFRFTEPGTYFYKSVYQGSDTIIMAGRVVVSASATVSRVVGVTHGLHVADYTSSLTFTGDVSLTPVVTSISPLTANVDTPITITGSGFVVGSTTVLIGGKVCLTTTDTATVIVCQVQPSEALAVGRHDVTVNVAGQGNALIQSRNLEDRSVIFLPTLLHTNPVVGSLGGGALVTVTGSGFSDSTSVLVGTDACVITSITYTTITCESPVSAAEISNLAVSVTESGVTANCTGTCTFTYAEASTAHLSTQSNSVTADASVTTVTLTGTGFGVDANVVEVRAGDTDCAVTSITDVEIVCDLGRMAVGSHILAVRIDNTGYAVQDGGFSNIITSPALFTSLSPSTGSINGGTIVTLTGNGFVAGDVQVTLGGAECAVVNGSTTLSEVTCQTPANVATSRRRRRDVASAGNVDVVITSGGVAYPTLSFEFAAAATPEVASVSPSEGYGGQSITLSGSGFGTSTADVTVEIPSDFSNDSVACDVTAVTDSDVTCTLGAREGGSAVISVHVAGKGFATYSGTFQYSLAVDSVSPLSGSYGGRQDITITGQGFSHNTVVTVCGDVCEMISSSSTQINCYTPANSDSASADTSCDVVVTNVDSVTYGTSYVYMTSETPIITSVSPDRGGTGGGTVVTVTGSGFTLTGATPTVSIDGSPCIVSASSDTEITCETEPHQGSIQTQVQVQVGTLGIARQDSAGYYYIDRWSSIFTWGGVSLPTTQDFIIIQAGQTVLLDTHTAVLTMLLIDGGELIFDRNNNVSLSAENILITNGGRLEIGTEAEPYCGGHAEIIMYGQLRSPELPIYGAKTLGVRKGTLDLHGCPVPQTWTKLASTASAGDNQITLQHSVTWQAGDQIVIATSGLRHSQSENEKRTIASVSSDGFTLTLTEALAHTHHGFDETYGSHTVEFRAEVGLLTRNVVFRGTNDPQWHDVIPACPDGFDTGEFVTQTCFQGRFGEEVGSDQFGASIMMHAKEKDSDDVLARIEYVELTYVGQAFRLGRYPIHWHLMGDVTGMYVRGCALHQTFNRAVTIHGTHNLLVEHNVIYDIMGGAFFIEDGIETGNIIQYNLAVFVRQSTSLLNDDITPAAYWVTNPNNTLQHNHAAGGTHFGFWYRMHEHPDGPSFDANICQRKVELGHFENNTVHSQGWFGIWIFQEYFPMQGSSCSSTVPSPARFYSLTAWNTEKGAEWVDCGAMQFIDFVMVNNEKSGFDLKLITGTPWGEEGSMVKNAVVVGHSAFTFGDDANYETDIGVRLPFAPGLTVDNVEFYNMNRGGVAFGVTFIDGTCSVLCGGWYYKTQGLTFTDVTRKVVWRWEHEGVIEDVDGSLTGSAGMKVIAQSELFNMPECTTQTGDEFSSGFASMICQPSVRGHRFAINNVVPTSLEANDMIITNTYGVSTVPFAKKRLTHKPGWMALLASREEHQLAWLDGEQFTNITYSSKYYDFLSDDWMIVRHALTQAPDVISVSGNQMDVIDSTPLTTSSASLDWYYNVTSRDLQIMVRGDQASRKKRSLEVVDPDFTHVSVSPTIYRCLNLGCIEDPTGENIPPARDTPATAFRWSDLTLSSKKRSASHPCVVVSNGGRTVEILADAVADGFDVCWCLIDVPVVDLDRLMIRGVVEFSTNTSFTDYQLTAITILVYGGRIIAGHSPEDPFTKKLTITLRGNHSTDDVALPGVTLGSKALGCFGGCDFHGEKHDFYWTHLSQTANAGASVIYLQDNVDWEAGDEIVITTTGYRSIETEKRVISAISGNQVTLDSPLVYRHLGESYTVGDKTFDMRAEVGVLTRNIKIEGEYYDDMDLQAFGARVLVGYIVTEDITGWARFSDVEFHRTGQEGWTESYDPRFSLAWLNTGTVSVGRPSYVTGCAFHDGYSTAIGMFGANQINVTDNIVHRAIHDGVRVSGSGHRLVRNLVTVCLFRGAVFDRFEDANYLDWQASFELSEATDLLLINNTAAGSERLGFRVDGESCDVADNDTAWDGNVAHGCLHGIHMFNDGIDPCSLVRNFVVYKSWDFGVYHQTTVSVIVRNTVIADSTIGYAPLIYGPAALSHTFVDKYAKLENVTLIGRSQHFDSSQDFMDEANDKNLRIRSIAGPSKKAPVTPSGGKTGILLPLFQSGTSGAPFKPWHRNLNYPAIRGKLEIDGLTAHNYQLNSDGTRDLIFYTNPDNEDGYPGTYVQNAVLSNVDRDSVARYDRPSLGKINPSDCVDMECDGRKKVLIKDVDGSLLGAPGAIVPDAGFGWDDANEASRGLGDYRIPKTLLTATDGTRIPASDIIDTRGIVGTGSSNCAYVSQWQAFDCHGDGTPDYHVLAIESMDEDTETRRLSPLALLGDRTVDLNNGPQDHGWCAGYTCQKRISTFHTIVSANTHFHVFFSGYPPLSLRLHFLNVAENDTVRLGIYYPKPERLDIYRGDFYIHPQNSALNADGEYVTTAPPDSNPDFYLPPIDSTIHGANYMDRRTDILYVTLRGTEALDIRTAPAVIVQFGFPAVTVDDFFEENLVSNLAAYLGVPSYKIKMVNVVRETSRRRRDLQGRNTNSTETVTYTVELDDGILNTTETDPTVVASLLNAQAETIVADYQTGVLWTYLNATGTSLATTTSTTNITELTNDTYIVQQTIPTQIQISSLSSTIEEYLEFPAQPTLVLLDADNATVPFLGGTWSITVALIPEAGSTAQLLGNTTAQFVSGAAVFSGLKITHSGIHTLRFQITEPTTISIQSADYSINVTERQVQVDISAAGNLLVENADVMMTLQLQASTGSALEAVGYKGGSWSATVAFDDSSIYGSATVSGTTSFTFDNSTGQLSTTGLRISNAQYYHKYNLVFAVTCTGTCTSLNGYATAVQFYNPSSALHTNAPEGKNYAIELNGIFSRMTTAQINLATFETFFNNYLVDLLGSVYVSSCTATETGTKTRVEFRVNAADSATLAAAETTLLDRFANTSLPIVYKSNSYYVADTSCYIEVDTSCQTVATAAAASTAASEAALANWLIIVIALVCSVVFAIVIITLACFIKRTQYWASKGGKVNPFGGCYGGSQSSMGSNLLRFSPGASPEPPESPETRESYSAHSARVTRSTVRSHDSMPPIDL